MKHAILMAVLLAAGTLTGCGGGYGGGYARYGPPPPPVMHARPRAPGPGYVWVEGYQRWNGHRYHWVPGHWERAPRGRWR